MCQSLNLKKLKKQNTLIPSILGILILSFGMLLLSGCQSSQNEELKDKEEQTTGETDSIQVVTSISIIADFVEEIAGNKAEVEYIVPLGEEPEEYEPTPSDFQAISDAEIFFLNGYNIETWLEQVTESVTEDVKVVPTAEEGPTLPLEGTDIPDPHLWLDPILVRDYYVEKITSTLIDVDPNNEEYYQDRAEKYQEQLTKLDEQLSQKLDEIPQENRLIINTENCFKYYGETYDLKTDGIWELNAHEEGTPQQIARIVDKVKNHQVPAVFVESTIDPRYMENVAEETDVEIGKPIYTDALGEEGSKAENYLKMMKHNTELFVEKLSE
ncbi:metal ABC transporter solute-binding protein, Zn/Mn family [Natranaerobius thermophilus]|uniref:Periplasmic solute binding protein n=1 Tax=Natranaerobius thermophilus (strain ATCC BAA-1301 / DSM 18059 / JW/NM-WN-LF) TaxID=457570 RepID=B2A2Y1_NATTJ|nr:zinc ABC transporter substrate-binding protein [Natranaerobius thermophilus]ACB86353.1 periplasmic solute binding protein [Natranaerobius thermophilus JW/NM-WN-LF]